MFSLIKFLFIVMREFPRLLDIRFNGFSNVPNPTKYLAMIMLSCFWCLAFGLYIGELLLIGYNMVGHIAIVTMAFVTGWVVRSYKIKTPARGIDYLRAPDRSSRCDELTEEQRLAAVQRLTQKV